MTNPKYEFLKLVDFYRMENWSASPSISLKTAFDEEFNVKLANVITPARDGVNIEDDKQYTRITIRQYGQGVFPRDTVFGVDIGTKKQFIATAGQLIVSGIDARNGSIGIVPNELTGAIVTNDFWLFDISDKVVPQYLSLLLSSERFQQYWQSKSSGTTNRQRINKTEFLEMEIPLPITNVQNEIVNKYNALVAKAEQEERRANELEETVDNILLEELGVEKLTESAPKPSGTYKYLQIASYANLHDRWETSDEVNHIISKLDEGRYSYHSISEKFNFVTRPWKKTKESEEYFNYIELSGVDKDFGVVKASKVATKNAPSRATQVVKEGDLIIGMTRPYLKNFAIVGEGFDDDICSSGFQVVEPSEDYDLRYLKYALMSELGMLQFSALMTGALYPAVNQAQLGSLVLPFPSAETQKKIADKIFFTKKQIQNHKKEAVDLRKCATNELNSDIFGILEGERYAT